MVTDKQLTDYEKGSVEIKDILGLDAKYLEQLKGRAQLFLDGGNKERALMMLEMLEELDRSDPMPSLLAAEILLEQGRSDAADEKIREVIEHHPDSADAKVALAELQIATGELVAAAETLEQVLTSDPNGETDAGKRALAVAARAHAQLESV